jgi:hypothetical protein
MPSVKKEVVEQPKKLDLKQFNLPSGLSSVKAIIIVGKDKQVKRYE